MICILSCTKKDSEEIESIDVDNYIELLKSNQYDSGDLPVFTNYDIPALLQYRDELQIICVFPRNGISSFSQRDCKLGVYVLWTIESIRAVAINSEYLIGRFPSQNPIVQKREDWSGLEHGDEVHKIISQAYFDWWEGNKHKDFDEFKNVDPLIETEYRWH
jgi:hypothetical protein